MPKVPERFLQRLQEEMVQKLATWRAAYRNKPFKELYEEFTSGKHLANLPEESPFTLRERSLKKLQHQAVGEAAHQKAYHFKLQAIDPDLLKYERDKILAAAARLDEVGEPITPSKLTKAPFSPVMALPIPDTSESKLKALINVFQHGEPVESPLKVTASGWRVTDFPDRVKTRLDWLVKRGYLTKEGRVYKLSSKGRQAIKLLSLPSAATIGGAVMLSDEPEAQAMPPGIFKKVTEKTLKGAESSASKVLAGKELGGKIIKKVLKGKGKWRKIIFNDNTEMTVEKQYVNDLCRALGTKDYVKRFQEQEGEAKTLQALKSLKYHEARAQPVSREYTRHLHQLYLTRAAEMSKELPPDTVFVVYKNKFFSMPKEYAEHLEDLGYLKIQRTRRDLQALKPKPKRIKKPGRRR